MARVTVADVIGSQLRKAFGGAISDEQSTLDKVAETGASATDAAFRQGLFGGGNLLSDLLGGLPGIGGITRLVGGPFGDLIGNAGEFLLSVAAGWAVGEFISEVTRPVWSELVQDVYEAVPSLPLDAATAARTAARGITGHDDSATEASRTGINADRFNHLYHDAMTQPTLAEVVELLNRKLIQNADAIEALQRGAYDPAWHDRLLELRRQLLSPADLALALLRGDIDAETMLAYGAQLGVTEADMNLLVGNTGEPPGAESLMEALRRGFIDEPRFERGIKQSRIRNEWIPTMLDLRYSPMSLADAVRSVVENYLTSEQGQAIAEQNGLLPEHWDTLVKSWGRPLAHVEMASLVHRGRASRAQFDQAMRESDLKDKYIDLAFEVATPLLPERLIVQAIQHNAITTQEGAKILLQRGYTQESVSILLKLGLHEQTASSHELTRAQITTLYGEGGLSRADALTYLEALGYSAPVANYELEIVDLRLRAAETRAEVSAVRVSYLAGGIDAAQAQTELRNLGLADTVALGDIATWDREKRRASKSLTESQIVKAAKNQVVSVDEAITLLEAVGYTRANAAILLDENGVSVGA